MSTRSEAESDQAEEAIGRVGDAVVRSELRRELDDLRADPQRDWFRVVVFGTTSAGKTSLIRALIGAGGEDLTSPSEAPSRRTIESPEGVLELTDTPGISGTGRAGIWNEAEALELAMRCDLLLFVVDRDLLRAEFEALTSLLGIGKRVLVVFNKKDLFPGPDLAAILAKLRDRLEGRVPAEDVVDVAAHPRPLPVRVRLPDGREETVYEYEEPALGHLEARIEAVLAREGGDLRAGNLLLRSYLLRRSAEEQLRLERRRQAEAIVDRHAWMAAASAFAVPVPELDLVAATAVEYRMVSEIGALYGADLSPEHIRLVGRQMVETLLRRRVVETATALVAGVFKSSLIGYAAGGLVEAATLAYLTRLTGMTFIDYFERGQTWGEEGVQGAVARQIDRNGRAGFLREFVQRAVDRLLRVGRGRREA
jgi:uncharacterized protein (DUF697 family)/GTPase SAR1 family protein